jgi:hypothetical protein
LRETPDERQVKAKKRHPKSRTTPFRQGVQWPESRTTPARLGDKWIAESRKPGRQMNLGDMRKARRHKPERETNELGDIQSAGHHDSDRDNKWIGRLGDKWIGWWINLKRWPSSAQPLREPLMCMYIFVCMYTYVHLYIYVCTHAFARSVILGMMCYWVTTLIWGWVKTYYSPMWGINIHQPAVPIGYPGSCLLPWTRTEKPQTSSVTAGKAWTI